MAFNSFSGIQDINPRSYQPKLSQRHASYTIWSQGHTRDLGAERALLRQRPMTKAATNLGSFRGKSSPKYGVRSTLSARPEVHSTPCLLPRLPKTMSHSTRTQDVEISNFRDTECDGVTSSQSQASQGQISDSKVVSLDRSRSAGDLSP